VSTFPRGDVGGSRKIFLGAEAKSVAESEGSAAGSDQAVIRRGSDGGHLTEGLAEDGEGTRNLAPEARSYLRLGPSVGEALDDILGSVGSDRVTGADELVVQKKLSDVGHVTVGHAGENRLPRAGEGGGGCGERRGNQIEDEIFDQGRKGDITRGV
jgi:hypothetical protein